MAKISALYAEGADDTGAESVVRSHHRPHGDSQRQQALVLAAFHLIAERGFEGLRTREVAARAGVNIATLHYYFATKEALIWGVRDYIGAQYMVLHAPGYWREGAPLERLRMEFADAGYYKQEQPELVTVLQELYLRSRRDPTVQAVLDDLEHYWHTGIEAILRDGVQQGVFRADLDPVAATHVITSFIRGQNFTDSDKSDFERECAEIERWLLVPTKGNAFPA